MYISETWLIFSQADGDLPARSTSTWNRKNVIWYFNRNDYIINIRKILNYLDLLRVVYKNYCEGLPKYSIDF